MLRWFRRLSPVIDPHAWPASLLRIALDRCQGPAVVVVVTMRRSLHVLRCRALAAPGLTPGIVARR